MEEWHSFNGKSKSKNIASDISGNAGARGIFEGCQKISLR